MRFLTYNSRVNVRSLMNTKHDDKTIKRLAIFALASVAIFIMITVISFVSFFVNTDGEREVIVIPSFVGLGSSEVVPTDTLDFERELVFSDEIPEGQIMSQFPHAGARRKIADGEKYTVKLTVSMGKETERVPELEGYQYTDAASALRSMDAKIRIVSIYDDTIDPGVVLGSAPSAGNAIEKGDCVTLFVSRRHIKGSVCVEDLVGLSREAACGRIFAEGLFVGEISYAYSDQYEAGRVISQSLPSKSYVRHGSYIDICVSEGKEEEQLHPFGRYITEKE